MSILSALFSSGKARSIEEAFGAKNLTGTPMKEAIAMWLDLYFDTDTSPNEDNCQRLPVVIVNKLVKTIFSEYEAKTPGEGSKAEFITRLLSDVDSMKNDAMQQCLIGGECFIKPILSGKGFVFSVIRRDCYLPFARNDRGEITDVGTAEFTTLGGRYYTLLERRRVGADGRLTIESKLFASDNSAYIGTSVPLGTLEKYAALQPVAVLPIPLGNIGLVPLKTPLANCVDGSPGGVAIYAPAVKLIRRINRNEQQLNDEFENGASRIIASEDMITKDKNGKREFSDKLFVSVDDSPENVGVTIFSPTLREQSYLTRKNEYLRNIESLIGLKRGILSEIEAVERTATEITSSAGDYNLTIIDFQQVWETALRQLVATCDKLGQMYKLCDSSKVDPDTDIVVDWGNGILYDGDKTWAEYMQMVQSGMLRPELALAWKFNLPCETPEDIVGIRAKYMPDMEAMTGGE